MPEFKETYDRRYLEGYRDGLSGYEIARWQALRHFISKRIEPEKIKKILDYGCGSGLFVSLWQRLFPQADLFLCDLSPVALKKLAETFPDLGSKCFVIEGSQAPFSDAFFDLVVSVEVIEHVEKLDDFLADTRRLLKPGGSFVWTTPCANRFSIEQVYAMLTRQVQPTAEGYRRWRWEDPGHLRRLKSGELNDWLRGLGYGHLQIRFRAHFFSFVCDRFFKKRLKRLGEKLMLLDYLLFRALPNGASMIGYARKG